MKPKAEPLKLDLGCGQVPREGFKGVDLHAPKVDFRVNLFKYPWPFKAESVDEIYSSHFFEHIPKGLRPFFMDECYRILRPEGKMTIIVPYWQSMRSIQDFTHEWPPISESSFVYFNKKWREDTKLTHGDYAMKCDFDFVYGYNVGGEWSARAPEVQQFAVKHYNNVAEDLIVNITKRPKSLLAEKKHG